MFAFGIRCLVVFEEFYLGGRFAMIGIGKRGANPIVSLGCNSLPTLALPLRRK